MLPPVRAMRARTAAPQALSRVDVRIELRLRSVARTNPSAAAAVSGHARCIQYSAGPRLFWTHASSGTRCRNRFASAQTSSTRQGSMSSYASLGCKQPPHKTAAHTLWRAHTRTHAHAAGLGLAARCGNGTRFRSPPPRTSRTSSYMCVLLVAGHDRCTNSPQGLQHTSITAQTSFRPTHRRRPRASRCLCWWRDRSGACQSTSTGLGIRT